MKAAIYCRVSSEEQTTENQNIALKQLAVNRGYEVVAVYKENDTAWKRGHQAELERCKEDAFMRNWEVLLVWDIDRLSRLGPYAMFGIVQHFWDLNIKVVSLQQTWLEVNDMIRPILISVFASMSQWESDKRSERTRAGILRRKQDKPIKPRGKDKRRRQRRSDIGQKHRYKKVPNKSDTISISPIKPKEGRF